MAQLGTGGYTYELIRDFFKLPAGQTFGMISRVAADAQGRYRVPELGVGQYEVQASKTGFSTVVHKGITLAVGSQTVVDFALPVGQPLEAQLSRLEAVIARESRMGILGTLPK